MHSIYIQQLAQPVAASLVMCMHGYTGGVATAWVLPYPAESFTFNNPKVQHSKHISHHN